MNSPASPSLTAQSTLDVGHHPMQASLATLGTAALLTPLAAWQYGSIGVAVVAAFVVAVAASIAVSAWSAASLVKSNRPAAGLLAASGIRMVLPLAVALSIVVQFNGVIPAPTVLYVVPLYLAMLLTELVCQWRGRPDSTPAPKCDTSTNLPPSSGSIAGGQQG